MENKLESPPAVAARMGYPWQQLKGQRHFGPLPGYIQNPPRGTEVFVGKIPRDSDENELVPLFSQAGEIYSMRIMMDFSGYNRGFAFVRYMDKRDARKAVKIFNGYRLRGDRRIGVSLSVDNCRLFIGGLPKEAKKEEVAEEFGSIARGIVNVIMYPNPKDLNLNRGFAFLEFDSHRSAAAARRDLIPCPQTRFGKLMVDWAEPEPEIDEDVMEQVKILYVRNLNLITSEGQLADLFNCVVKPETIQRVKKINDYAFVHFKLRTHAEKSMKVLNGVRLDGCEIEIHWARPVEDKSLYKLKKMINKGMMDQTLVVNSDIKDIRSKDKAIMDSSHKKTVNRATSGNLIKQMSRIGIPITKSTNASSYSMPIPENTSGPGHIFNDPYVCQEMPQYGMCHTEKEPVNFKMETSSIEMLNSKSFVLNSKPENYVEVLHNICSYYRWYEPTYEFRCSFEGRFYHCGITLCIGKPFNVTPIFIGPVFGSYSHPTEFEAKNDAAKNAVCYIDEMCNVVQHQVFGLPALLEA